MRRKSAWRRAIEQAILSRLTLMVSWLAGRLSVASLRRLADAVAPLVILLFPSRQRLADSNMAAAFPEMSPRERRAVRFGAVYNICRTMAECLKLASLSREALNAMLSVTGFEHMRAAMAEGRGVILLTAHYGNWEWLGARAAQELGSLAVVARDAPHALTARLINEARESHGMTVMSREDLRSMLTVLRQGKPLGILPDQHATVGGILIDFLGRPAWTFTGPALLATRTNSGIFPGFCTRLPDGTMRVEIHPEVPLQESGDRRADLVENTRRINGAIERQVRAHPEQWLWLHDRWKTLYGKSDEENS